MNFIILVVTVARRWSIPNMFIYIHIYWFYIQYTQYMYIDKIRNDMSILRYTLERRLRECKDKGDWLYSWIDCFLLALLLWYLFVVFILLYFCIKTFKLYHHQTYYMYISWSWNQKHQTTSSWPSSNISQGTWLFQLTTDCLQISIVIVVAVLRLWHGIFVVVSQDNWVVFSTYVFIFTPIWVFPKIGVPPNHPF